MSYFYVLPFGVLLSLIFCIQRRKGFSIPNLMFKAVSSLCFILTAVLALMSNPEAKLYGELVIFGGVLGLVGDISLDLKGIYQKDEDTYLKAGFISFLIGHIFYSTAIVLASNMKWWLILLSIAISIVVSAGNLISSKIMKLDMGKYKRIVFCYVILLALTTVLSVVAMITSGFDKAYILLAIGAVSFTLSDVILSLTYFGEGKDTGFYYFINHFLYYAGQYLIAASIMYI